MTAAVVEQTPQEWIESLPCETYFWGRDVPGNPSTARVALSRLSATHGNGIIRVAPGLYWRGLPDGHPDAHWSRPHGRGTSAALVYAGPGAGMACWAAVSDLGWAHQGSRYSKIAVVRRRLKPTESWVRFVRRENLRRLDLSWLEVSLLEALPQERYMEYPWELRRERLLSGLSGASIGCPDGLRMDRLAWAAETDDLATPDLLGRIAEIRDELPEFVAPIAGRRVVKKPKT